MQKEVVVMIVIVVVHVYVGLVGQFDVQSDKQYELSKNQKENKK